jgi:hypothetical protein
MVKRASNVKAPKIGVFGPEYVIRVVFIYSRHTECPKWSQNDEIPITILQLLNSNYFFFDCVYTHKKPDTKESVRS